jgi:pimeloyl-ACP methyl ester carboxylesterase
VTRILYLHGFASSPQSGKALFFKRKFAELGIALEIPDLEQGCFEDLTISGQLAVIERQARGERVCLMGSSLGGYLAALYASRHPEVEKLVLLAPAFYFPRRWQDTFGAAKVEDWKREGVLPFYHYADECMRDLKYRFIEDAEGYEAAPEFGQPALVFHGTMDEVVPPSYSQEFAAVHPNVRLRLMNSGHELKDVLEEMWAEVAPFLL